MQQNMQNYKHVRLTQLRLAVNRALEQKVHRRIRFDSRCKHTDDISQPRPRCTESQEIFSSVGGSLGGVPLHPPHHPKQHAAHGGNGYLARAHLDPRHAEIFCKQ
ncbi:hypothetical protein EYF80_021939 [Liparis tanakae]|uniref:Uncharacterized protein n=1 Tax=Liparis tanakae TaxID=230148 RepID=A0A4Z2HR48_9TELE|nr:hypothetical protein EYF80_021939 [Liparis tanakae]